MVRSPLSPRAQRALPLLLLLFLGSLWGMTFSVAKLAMQDGFHPVQYAFWQCGGAGLILALIAVLKGERFRPSRALIVFGLTVALIGIALPNVNFYFVLPHMPAGLAAVIITTAPLATYVGALLLGMEQRSRRRLLGILVGFSGGMILVLPGAGLPAGTEVVWVLAGFLTPLLYASSGLYTARQRPAGASSLLLAVLMTLSAALWLLPGALLVGPLRIPLPPDSTGDWAVLVQIAVTTVAYVIFFELMRIGGPVFFSQVGYVVTITGIVWGSLLFGETHGFGLYLATAIVFLGLILVNQQPKRTREALTDDLDR